MLNDFLIRAFPARTPEGRAVLRAVAAMSERRQSSEHFALQMGYRSRHQMSRSLARAGLPPLEEIIAWAAIAEWLLRCETRQTTLCRLSLVQARDPSVSYRRVKRVTGKTWKEVLMLGSAWLLTAVWEKYGYYGAEVATAEVGTMVLARAKLPSLSRVTAAAASMITFLTAIA
jgi:hypothetical protein